MAGSADPAFHGDPTRRNHEDLVVASLSACHQLLYFALCSQDGLVVTAYEDSAERLMVKQKDGAGQFVPDMLRRAWKSRRLQTMQRHGASRSGARHVLHRTIRESSVAN